MAILRVILLSFNWLVIALGEMLLLTAGLISPGHDKGRLIPIAFFVIILPVIGYGIHRLIIWLMTPKSSH